MAMSFCRVCGDSHRSIDDCPVLRKREDASIQWAMRREEKRKAGFRKRPKANEFSSKVKRQVWGASRRRCAMCGDRLARTDAEIDHKVPVSKGGHSGFSNGQVLCKPCHARKTKEEIADGWTKRFKSDSSWSRRLEQRLEGVTE